MLPVISFVSVFVIKFPSIIPGSFIKRTIMGNGVEGPHSNKLEYKNIFSDYTTMDLIIAALFIKHQ